MTTITAHICLVFCLFTWAALTSHAATFTVNLSGDAGDFTCDGTCTLRDAIDDANGLASNDTINFASYVNTITLNNAEIVIANNGSLTIAGAGSNILVVDGGPGTNRIFWTNPGSVVTISGMTLTGGNGTGSTFHNDGGAIYSNSATLTLDRVYVTGNSSVGWGGGVAIQTGANHRILNSTISQNSTLSVCGGFFSVGSITVVNSTIYGNSTSSSGGGGLCSFANMVMRNTTVTGNISPNAGGIAHQSGNLNIGNSIVAGNTSTNNQQHEIYVAFAGGVTSAGNNLIGDSVGDSTNTLFPISFQASDIQNVSPQLINLGLYGGNIPTMPLQFGSPARDAGSDALAVDPSNGNGALTTDARGTGFPRIVDTAGGTDDVDIGAFEIQDTRYYVTQYFVTLPAGACDDLCYLREAINAVPAGGTIDFTRAFSPATPIEIGSSEIFINKNLTIAGYGANRVIIDGGPATNRLFYINGRNVNIRDVTLTGGNGTGTAPSGSGGAIYVNGGSLSLDGVHVAGNLSTGNGGGVYFALGSGHRVRNSTFSANNSAGNCGALGLETTTLTMVNSTLSGNTATAAGGGLCNLFGSNTTLRNVTIAGNTALIGGGISHESGTLNLGNTIDAGNTANGANPPDIFYSSGILLSAGNNLIGINTSTPFPVGNPNGNNDRVGDQAIPLDPQLAALTNNGGTTPTRALLGTSPAIDSGDNAKAVDPFDGSPLTTDQRGFTRIVDAPLVVPIVDIGAFEFFSLPSTAAIVTVSGRILSPDGRGVSNAIVTMTDSTGEKRTARSSSFGYYRFDEVVVGGVYILDVSYKRYQFNARGVAVTDEINDMDFVALPINDLK